MKDRKTENILNIIYFASTQASHLAKYTLREDRKTMTRKRLEKFKYDNYFTKHYCIY